MKCIIPLAGPDIFTDEYGLKPGYDIDGTPLVVKAIHSRSWYSNTLFEEDLIFVLRNFDHLAEMQTLLQSNFPKANQVIIPTLTKGALMTSLAGISLINDFSDPIIIDLVDILFSGDLNPVEIFNNDESIAGILPYFISDNPKYSYLEIDENSNVLRTREKETISQYASAGVYFFNNLQTFLRSADFSIKHLHKLSYNGLLFLCPSFNGIINNRNSVKAIPVQVTNEISLLFH